METTGESSTDSVISGSMTTQSEGSIDFELRENIMIQSEGSTDSVQLGNTANQGEGSKDFVLLENMPTQSEGSKDSVLLENMPTQSEGSTDSELLRNRVTTSESSTDSVISGNMPTQSEGSLDFELLEKMITQSEGSTDSVLLENIPNQSEGSTDFVLLENMTTQNVSSCIEKDSGAPKYVNILILGDAGIGKTTLINSYLDAMDIHVEELDIDLINDIFPVYPLRMKYNGYVLDIVFLDLHNGTNSPERRDCYPIGVNVIILCFSIGHYSTLKSVYNLWIHEIRSHFGKITPIVLVGLKSDMRLIKPGTLGAAILLEEGNRVVEQCEAEAIHQNYQFHGDYVECSKSDKDSVIHVIENALHVAMEDLISV